MRKIIFLTSILATGAAHADWVPRIESASYTANLTVNGSNALAYSEDKRLYGPLGGVAREMQAVPATLQSGLNAVMSQQITANGARFLDGTLSGNAAITIRPQSSGVAALALTGLSYQVRSGYSGKKWGVFSYDCVNTTTMSNIAINAQYGTADGNMPADQVGMTANVSSSTDCDSNLSWILPVLGNLLIKNAEGKISSAVQDGVKGGLAKIKDVLFFQRDANWLVGLNRLIPADKVVQLPDGSSFPIGQYVQNNLGYLLANSQISINLGAGAPVRPVYGMNEPQSDVFSGDIITLAVSSPAVSFAVQVGERSNVSWSWKCSIRDPSRVCQIP
ncbi:hypothetical protein ACFDR9_003795 [Janthinobacterium sp. CG_23.3]|uniref:hypothetical protein n=1 Tax=Janthinobacterium sp. CG_23.3 TaxID=3349634 RepID=UPI0038D48044